MSCEPTRTNQAATTPTATITPATAHHGVGFTGSLLRGTARKTPNARAGITRAASGMSKYRPIG
jgi:hypothetical protein